MGWDRMGWDDLPYKKDGMERVTYPTRRMEWDGGVTCLTKRMRWSYLTYRKDGMGGVTYPTTKML